MIEIGDTLGADALGMAGQRGFGFIDVHQAFMDAVAAAGGSAAFQATYMSDETHPNSLAQSTIWAPAVGDLPRCGG